MGTRLSILAILLVFLAGCASDPETVTVSPEVERAAIDQLLDDFYQYASTADSARYVDLFHPTGYFIGTDATERWTRDAFANYLGPYFRQGRGWSYEPIDRVVTLAPDGRYAWFDEALRSASYGTSRGTGSAIKTAEGWKITQYHLSFPVPNAMARTFTDQVKAAGY